VALVPNPFLNQTSNPFNATDAQIPVQIGIVSFGARGCTEPFTVFTRVHTYGPTILDSICSVQGKANDVCQFYSGYSANLAKDPLRNVAFANLGQATLATTGTWSGATTRTMQSQSSTASAIVSSATPSRTAIVSSFTPSRSGLVSSITPTGTRTIVPTPSSASKLVFGWLLFIVLLW
jgi:secreted trypsin-like serine protease